MTIYEALRKKLGREPTNAELRAEVDRIKREAYEEAARKGKLPHQRKRNPMADNLPQLVKDALKRIKAGESLSQAINWVWFQSSKMERDEVD